MLNPKGDLSAAELAFFAPAFIISLFVLFRHGFGRQLGWFYICILSILRIVGAAATLYSQTKNDYSVGILTTAAITSAVGTAPLLLALMGFLRRINLGMGSSGLPALVFHPIHIAALAGLVIAILGGTDEADGGAKAETGRTLMKVAAIIFLGMYLALSAITLLNVTKTHYVLSEERTLLRACVIALPFLAVRLVYTVAASFSHPDSIFYYQNVNVYVQAFMQFAMEAIVVAIYITAGMMTPKAQKQDPLMGSRDPERGHVEMMSDGTKDYGRVPQRSPGPQRPGFQPPRNIGDYRPSRLIRNAIRDRQ